MFYCFWIDSRCVWLFCLWRVYRGFHTGCNRIYHRFCYSYGYSFDFWYEEVNQRLWEKSWIIRKVKNENFIFLNLVWYLCIFLWFYFIGFFLLLNYIKFNEFDYILLFKVAFVFFIAGFVIPIPELIKLRNKMIIG